MAIMVPAPLPSSLLDSLLHQAPLDVLLFDTELVCRYAALAGETLFDRTADRIVGRSAGEIFPPANGDLSTALRLAAEGASGSVYAAYRYTHAAATTQTYFCWSVRVEPVLLHDYRGREEFRGVLVTLTDIQDLADANDRLVEENARLRRALADADQRERNAREARRALRTSMRNLLAPVTGYLQVLSRRPAVLRGMPIAEVIDERVLPGLAAIVDTVDSFEQAEPPRADASPRPDDGSHPPPMPDA